MLVLEKAIAAYKIDDNSKKVVVYAVVGVMVYE